MHLAVFPTEAGQCSLGLSLASGERRDSLDESGGVHVWKYFPSDCRKCLRAR
jgi:hypothetical protein